LKGQLEALETRKGELEGELAGTKSEIDGLKEELETAKTGLQAARDRASTLQADLTTARAENTRLQATLEGLQADQESLQAKLDALREKANQGIDRETLLADLESFLMHIASFRYFPDEKRKKSIDHYVPGGADECGLDDGPFAYGCDEYDLLDDASEITSTCFIPGTTVLLVSPEEYVVLVAFPEAIEILWTAKYQNQGHEEARAKQLGKEKSQGAVAWARATKEANEVYWASQQAEEE